MPITRSSVLLLPILSCALIVYFLYGACDFARSEARQSTQTTSLEVLNSRIARIAEKLRADLPNDGDLADAEAEIGLGLGQAPKGSVHQGRLFYYLGALHRKRAQMLKGQAATAEFTASAEELSRAIAVFEMLPEHPMNDIAQANRRLGSDYHDLRMYPLALLCYAKAASAVRPLAVSNASSSDYLVEVLRATAITYRSLNQYDKAAAAMKDAMTFVSDNKHPEMLSRLHELAGDDYRNNNEIDTALIEYNAGLIIRQDWLAATPSSAVKTVKLIQRNIAASLNDLGLCYFATGNYGDALFYFEQARDLKLVFGSDADKFYAINNVASVCATLGQLTRAAELFGEEVPLLLQIGTPEDKAKFYSNFSECLRYDRKPDEALKYIRKARDIYAETPGNEDKVSQCRICTGLCYLQQRKFADAMIEFQAAKGSTHKLSSEEDQARINASIGLYYIDTQKYGKAIGHLTDALAYYRANFDPSSIAATLDTLGQAYAGVNRFSDAEGCFHEAMDRYEQVGSQLVKAQPDQLGNYQQVSQKGFYARYAAMLLRKGNSTDALRIIERGRSQGLIQQRIRNHANVASILSSSDASKLAIAEQKLKNADISVRSSFERASGKQSSSEAARIQADIASSLRIQRLAYHGFLETQKALSAANPAYSQLLDPNQFDTNKLKQLCLSAPDTLFLEYAVADTDSTLLFACSKSIGLRVFPLAVGTDEIGRQVDNWRKYFTQPTLTEDKAERAQAAQLYAMLFGKLVNEGILRKGRYGHVVVAGDGPLLDMPFSALVDESGDRLIQWRSFSSVTSFAPLLWSPKSATPSRTLLCIGDPISPRPTGNHPTNVRSNTDPALKCARDLIQAISEKYSGSSNLLDDKATKRNVLDQLKHFAIIHFGTHGYLNTSDGLGSWLTLTPDMADPISSARLYGYEVVVEPLTADLAVLSACKTALGTDGGGDGLMGLTWAFLAAGCKSTVGSLWEVDAPSTTDLMKSFYDSLLMGKRKDEALRSAVKDLWVSGKRAPYWWAGFQVFGKTEPIPASIRRVN